jgi:hypothetical protein
VGSRAALGSSTSTRRIFPVLNHMNICELRKGVSADFRREPESNILTPAGALRPIYHFSASLFSTPMREYVPACSDHLEEYLPWVVVQDRE